MRRKALEQRPPVLRARARESPLCNASASRRMFSGRAKGEERRKRCGERHEKWDSYVPGALHLFQRAGVLALQPAAARTSTLSFRHGAAHAPTLARVRGLYLRVKIDGADRSLT
jgi:hypothetical protein